MENNENNNIVQTHSCKKECLWVALLTFAGSFLAFYLLAHQTYLHYFSPMKNKISKMEENIVQDFSKMEKDGSFNIIYRGDSLPIYPDNLYFEPDDDVLRLTEHGVPIKCACAVLRDNNYMA